MYRYVCIHVSDRNTTLNVCMLARLRYYELVLDLIRFKQQLL